MAHWRADMANLKHRLIALNQTYKHRDHYYSSVVFINRGNQEELRKVDPWTEARGVRVAETAVVPCPDEGFHIHLQCDNNTEDSSHELLGRLREELRGVRNILKHAPKRTVPQIVFPSQGNALKDNFTYWRYLLHFLSDHDDNTSFSSNIEFLPTVNGYDEIVPFRDWAECCTLPEFDPVPFLTMTAGDGKPMKQWRAEHVENGTPLPEVISASLSKPLLYATINAIKLLIQPPEKKTPRQQPTASKRKVKTVLDPDSVLVILMKHHKRSDGTICDKQLFQQDLEEVLGWNQSRVSRAIQKLFGDIPGYGGVNPMICYRRLCETGRIGRELTRLWEKFIDPPSHDRNIEDADNRSDRGY